MNKPPTQNINKTLTPTTARQIIANIPNNKNLRNYIYRMKTPNNFTIHDCQKFFETMYLLALRVGEVCGIKTEQDKNKHTGHTLKAKKGTYQPDPYTHEEINALTYQIYTRNLQEGKEQTPTLKDILAIKEPAGFFYVQTEKRKDQFTRETVIPFNDPLTQPVLDYIISKQDTPPIFKINRLQALRIANIIFEGYTYTIETYKTNKHGTLTIVPQQQKKVGDHALRHTRLTELKKLGIRGTTLKAFVGWSPTAEEKLEQTYTGTDTYHYYMPFLLTAKI